MARSSCIYVIMHNIPDADYPIIATFTVKHECKTWLENCTHQYKHEFVVRRFRDNPCNETYSDQPETVDLSKTYQKHSQA